MSAGPFGKSTEVVPRKILYLTQWFDPEPVLKGLDFAKALAERGYDVEVATGFPNYPTGRLVPGYRIKPYQREVRDGIVVHRLPLYPSHSRSSMGRIANYLSFFFSALLFLLVRSRRYDVIYVYHPPITVGLAAVLAFPFARRPFIIDVQDLWPDSLAASGMGGTGLMSRILRPICRFVYRRAALVIGQSKAMTERLVERGADRSRALTIFNWANEQAARANRTFDPATLEFEGRFNFVFAGNLGRVQGLESLIRAANLAGEQVPDIQLTLIGEGVERPTIEQLIAELGSGHVKLRPGVPLSQIGDVLSAADVLAIHLIDDPLFEVTIPSKTQFYMAMGKPILIGVRGEAADIVTRVGAGIAVAPEDVEAIAHAMVQFARMAKSELEHLGRNAITAYSAQYSFAAAIANTSAAVDSLIDAGVPIRT